MAGETLQFGPYTLGDKLRDDPVESVYAATSGLGMRMEVHILRREHDGDAALRTEWVRRAESIAAARLRHVVRVERTGTERGRAFYATAAPSGDTLATYLEQRTPDDAEAATIARQVAEALTEAHAVGVAGWDLRPGAIRYDPKEGALLTRWFEPMPASGTLLQAVDAHPYRAPELSDGPPDERADVFAAGVLLLSILAGRDPTMRELEARVTPAGLSSNLAAVLRRCLDSEAVRRYQRMSEVVAALADSEPTVIASRVGMARAVGENATQQPDSARAALPVPLDRIVTAVSDFEGTKPGRVGATPSSPSAVEFAEAEAREQGRVLKRRPTARVAWLVAVGLGLALAGVGAWFVLVYDDTQACASSRECFDEFTEGAARAAEIGDHSWFENRFVTNDCTIDNGPTCPDGRCVEIGVLGGNPETDCLNPQAVASSFDERRLFGFIYPSAGLFAEDGPALLFGYAWAGEAEPDAVDEQAGVMAVLRLENGTWRVASVLWMFPDKLYGATNLPDVTYLPGDAAVHPVWRPSDLVTQEGSDPNWAAPTATAAPPAPVNEPLGSGPPYAAIVARVEPDICANQRDTANTRATIIQCIVEGNAVTLERGPESSDGRNWWFVTARDGRQGWMAEDYLLLSTQTIRVDARDSNGTSTLRLDAIDIQPGGDLILQLAFTNDTRQVLDWQSDRGNPDIYLTDEMGRRILSAEAGGTFGRALPGGFRPGTTLFGWHRFVLPDLTYRGLLTLHYPNHGLMSFPLAAEPVQGTRAPAAPIVPTRSATVTLQASADYEKPPSPVDVSESLAMSTALDAIDSCLLATVRHDFPTYAFTLIAPGRSRRVDDQGRVWGVEHRDDSYTFSVNGDFWGETKEIRVRDIVGDQLDRADVANGIEWRGTVLADALKLGEFWPGGAVAPQFTDSYHLVEIAVAVEKVAAGWSAVVDCRSARPGHW